MIAKILLFGGIATAITAIITLAVLFGKFTKKVFQFVTEWKKWADEQTEHTKENYMASLRLVIMSPYMPLSERISAGDKYIANGGNGEVKHKYEELLNKLPNDKE